MLVGWVAEKKSWERPQEPSLWVGELAQNLVFPSCGENGQGAQLGEYALVCVFVSFLTCHTRTFRELLKLRYSEQELALPRQ